jgi:hypothetical protein
MSASSATWWCYRKRLKFSFGFHRRERQTDKYLDIPPPPPPKIPFYDRWHKNDTTVRSLRLVLNFSFVFLKFHLPVSFFRIETYLKKVLEIFVKFCWLLGACAWNNSAPTGPIFMKFYISALKKSREISCFIKIWQEQRVLYIKHTDIYDYVLQNSSSNEKCFRQKL